MVLAGVVIASLLVGFMAGLLSFKKSQEFCPQHGITKMCSICVSAARQQPVGR